MMRKMITGLTVLLASAAIAACGTTTPAANPTSAATPSAAVATASAVATTEATAETTASADTQTTATAGTLSATTNAISTTTAMADPTSAADAAATAETSATADASSAMGGLMGTNVMTDGTSLDVINSQSNLTMLRAALQSSGLAEQLSAAGPYTIFAPSDEAFAQLPAETAQKLLQDPAQLKTLLTYHATQGQLKTADITSISTLQTLEGEMLQVKFDGSKIQLNDSAVIITPNIETSNGVIHIIDRVLLPPSLSTPTS